MYRIFAIVVEIMSLPIHNHEDSPERMAQAALGFQHCTTIYIYNTRMHSSRMRTSRSSSHHVGGLHTPPPEQSPPPGSRHPDPWSRQPLAA